MFNARVPVSLNKVRKVVAKVTITVITTAATTASRAALGIRIGNERRGKRRTRSGTGPRIRRGAARTRRSIITTIIISQRDTNPNIIIVTISMLNM